MHQKIGDLQNDNIKLTLLNNELFQTTKGNFRENIEYKLRTTIQQRYKDKTLEKLETDSKLVTEKSSEIAGLNQKIALMEKEKSRKRFSHIQKN